jgi:uncharacterized protein YcbK (DUF882 family)
VNRTAPGYYPLVPPSCARPGNPASAGRRWLLQGAAAALVVPGLALAPGLLRTAPRSPCAPHAPDAVLVPYPWSLPRTLWVTRPQAQESVRAVYWADGRLQPEGYAALNHIYRDLHADAQHPIALGLLNLNFALQSAVHALLAPRPLVLLSGYRTAATNALVGGTRRNIHGRGQADDFIYEGLSLLDNYRLARWFQVGGLGLYPDRGSLHKDIGALRSWVTPGRGR